jgi:hypothetical protein
MGLINVFLNNNVISLSWKIIAVSLFLLAFPSDASLKRYITLHFGSLKQIERFVVGLYG